MTTLDIRIADALCYLIEQDKQNTLDMRQMNDPASRSINETLDMVFQGGDTHDPQPVPNLKARWPEDDVQGQQLFLKCAVFAGKWTALPYLHELGYQVERLSEDDQRAVKHYMAKGLGQGAWTCPDLLCPDIFTGTEGREMFEVMAAQLFLEQKSNGLQTHGMDAIHFQRIANLPNLPGQNQIQATIAGLLKWTLSDINKAGCFLNNSDYGQHLKTMMKAGWLDEQSFIAEIEEKDGLIKMIAPTIKEKLVRARAQLIDEQTPAALGKSKPPRL